MSTPVRRCSRTAGQKAGTIAGTISRTARIGLTDVKIRNAKAKKHRYRLSDSHGLALEVTPAGGKYWRYRYRLDDKENLFAGGEWGQAPIGETLEQAEVRRAGKLPLAEARTARLQWRADVKAGLHPRVANRARGLVVTQSRAETFDAVAEEFIEKRGGERSEQHRSRLKTFLEKDISPDVGALPTRSIQTSQLLVLLRKVEDRDATSIASLGRGYLGQIFRYAIQTKKAESDPTAGLKGALVKREPQHHEPLSRADIPAFFSALNENGARPETKIAINLARTIELRCAPWTELDLEGADWRLSAQRMKMRRPHIVPLSSQAIELLEELYQLTGKRKWLFPHVHSPAKYMGATTINRVLERMGYLDRFSAHGFRATASTMLHEAGWHSELIERQLATRKRTSPEPPTTIQLVSRSAAR